MGDFSIIDNKNKILTPNSLYERRVILQYYLDNNIEISLPEKEILQQSIAIEPESIGIIGCLLNDGSQLNTLRLAIGCKNKSNVKLANKSSELLKNLDIEKADMFLMMKENLSHIKTEVSFIYDQIYFSSL
jgi:hypothetical protein